MTSPGTLYPLGCASYGFCFCTGRTMTWRTFRLSSFGCDLSGKARPLRDVRILIHSLPLSTVPIPAQVRGMTYRDLWMKGSGYLREKGFE
jgi:hypothetical protein